ncbi:MAG TPA: hypothetical protein VFH63_02575 [candidate division Zixibacteria bacterium]|nr:hypothetical protein [candidate division Zixibacteria bacterium]
MENAGFVIAAYGVILGGTALYAAVLLRRLSAACKALLHTRRGAEGTARRDEDT